MEGPLGGLRHAGGSIILCRRGIVEKNERLEALTSQNTELRRDIGLFGGMSIIGGIMIGSGIFYLGAYVLQRCGMSLGLSLICWAVAGLISVLGGLCYAELGAAMPRSGGMTLYLNEAYHPILGFLYGFSDWLIGGPGSIAAIAIALPTALRAFTDIGDTGIKAIAIVLIAILSLYNCFGIRLSAILQNISMVAKLIPILIILFVALLLGQVSPTLGIQPPTGPVSVFDILRMLAFAIVASLWAYEGWANINVVAEEIREPHKNLPRALLFGIGGITILYVLFNYAIYRVLSLSEIQTMLDAENYYLGTAAAQKVLGNAGAVIVTVGMALSMFGALNGCIIAQPRTYYAMAQEGHFFSSFKWLHPKYKVPAVPMAVQCVFSIILVLFRSLASLVIFNAMFYYMLGMFAVIRLRRKYPDIRRPYRVVGYPVVPILIGLVFFGLLINTLVEDPANALLGLCVPAVGAVAYALFDLRLRRQGSSQ